MSLADKVILSCALTGAVTTRGCATPVRSIALATEPVAVFMLARCCSIR